MKTIYSSHKWLRILLGALLLAAGICIIIAAIFAANDVSTWLSVILAIALFISAAAFIFSGVFSLEKSYFNLSFVLAAIAIALGVVLCVNTQILGGFIVVFVSALLLAFGAVEIGEGAAMIYFKRKVVAIVLFFILGAILITLGVLSLCFKDVATQVIYFVLGALVGIGGIIEIIFGIKAAIVANKIKKAEKKVAKELEKINASEEAKDEPSEEKQVDENKEEK